MICEAFEYMEKHPVPGVLCEFGVYQGLGLESIAERSRINLGGGIPIYGFDTFEGMPKTSVTLHDNCAEIWRPGGYADTSMEAVQKRVPEAHLIKGNFNTLPALITYGIDRVRFARLDCDLYESYRDALRLLSPSLWYGTVLLFDEAVAPNDSRYHDSVRDSGERAVREWRKESGFPFRVIHDEWTERLAVIE